MTTTRTAPAPAVQLSLLVPLPALTVDGIPAQLDLLADLLTERPAAEVALDQLVADRAALADDDAAGIASVDAAIAAVAAVVTPGQLFVLEDAEYDATLDRHCHGRTKIGRRCSDRVVPEWKGSLVLSDLTHWCRQHAHQGRALTTGA